MLLAPIRILQEPLPHYVVHFDEELSLACDAVGFPDPEFQWFRDDALLTDETSKTLIIRRMRLGYSFFVLYKIKHLIKHCVLYYVCKSTGMQIQAIIGAE